MTEVIDSRYKRLKDYRFPEILLGISNLGKTGILHLKNWPTEKHLYIKNGKIVFASSNIEEDCLGINLLIKRKITVIQYYESIRMLEKTGKRHGSILVELGYLTRKALSEAIKNQIEEIVFGIFQWYDGYFFFEEIPFNIEEPIILENTTHSLIYKGIKKMDSFPQIRNALPFNTVLTQSQTADKILKKLKLAEIDKNIMGIVDGEKTVLDILTFFHEDDLETLKILYALNSIEAVVPVDQGTQKREAVLTAIAEEKTPDALYKKGTVLFINRKYNESANIFREAINLNPKNASYHFYLAMSLINTSMFEEAEDALIRAIEIDPFNDDYYTELGMVYKKRGIIEKAGRTFEFALRINPHNERARTILSEIKKQKNLIYS